jgi:D-proline reductase (dithiol) PrdB
MDDAAVGYMERTRHYYRALGYKSDYVWSSFPDVPFARLRKPLSQARIALMTTASPADFSNLGADGEWHVWSGMVSPPPELLSTDRRAWDRESTHTEDRETYLPIAAASALAADGVIGGLTARFHCVPTQYSQRQTMQEHAPELLARVREDGADAALLCAL